MAAQTSGVSITLPSFVSSANFVGIRSVPSSRSLMMMIDDTLVLQICVFTNFGISPSEIYEKKYFRVIDSVLFCKLAVKL